MDVLGSVVAFGAGLLVLWLVFKILSLPIRILFRLLINAVIGAVILIIFNFLGDFIGLSIVINPVTAVVTGLLGVPGVILLVILQAILDIW